MVKKSSRIQRIGYVVHYIALSLLGGCGMNERHAGETETVLLTTVDPSAQQVILAAKEDLFGRLSGRLMSVLQAEGPAAAIQVCSEEAPLIAQQVSRERGLQIARTSLKLRNLQNSPPDWARSIIQGAPAEPQYFDLGEGHVGALLPIKLQATCLLCHGDKESILDDVKVELARLYPKDTATGYKEGELRGWFWVDLPPEEGTER